MIGHGEHCLREPYCGESPQAFVRLFLVLPVEVSSATVTVREALAGRIRAALNNQPTLRERPLFGLLSFLINDRMVVGAREDGGLLVRADADNGENLLSRPGARIAEMGAGRSKGPSWLEIDREVLDDDTLAFWISAALDFYARGW